LQRRLGRNATDRARGYLWEDRGQELVRTYAAITRQQRADR
jgi:hypothetical protein